MEVTGRPSRDDVKLALVDLIGTPISSPSWDDVKSIPPVLACVSDA